MRVRVSLCLTALASAALCQQASAAGKPKGKAPLQMKVVKVAADHLVLHYVVARDDYPDEREFTTFKPAFKDLRVHDRAGKELPRAEWKKRVQAEAKVHVSADGKKVSAAQFRKLEKGALVVVWSRVQEALDKAWYEPYEPKLGP
jgi:hypothetical protein